MNINDALMFLLKMNVYPILGMIAYSLAVFRSYSIVEEHRISNSYLIKAYTLCKWLTIPILCLANGLTLLGFFTHNDSLSRLYTKFKLLI